MKHRVKDLDYWLGEISVMEVMDVDRVARDTWDLEDWYAVVTEDGITAYFLDKSAAFRYRLAEINRRLNG